MKSLQDWNPELYLKFADERTQPAIDLVNRIVPRRKPAAIIDIGCGPGNSGVVLRGRWPEARFLGIDSSPAMIEKAAADYPEQRWRLADARTFRSDATYDIVFSNATIQWIPGHDSLLESFVSLLSDRGALAVQIPLFNTMPIARTIAQTAHGIRWRERTAKCSSLFTYHDPGFYYDILSSRLGTVQLWETRYLHSLDSHEAVIEWIRATGLKPYLDNLNGDEKAAFEREVLAGVRRDYPAQKNGRVLFPFHRLFMIGYRD